jgi:hypothetical protein
MSGLRILITNNTLDTRAGTELYVRDIATALLGRGHTPIAFTTLTGDVARELRQATIPVIDDLDALAAPPDIIHGQHHLETMMALLRFPETPAIYVCHGWLPWEESPPRFPRIMRYIAIDDTCRDRLLYEGAIPGDRVQVLLNFVDLNRFQPRGGLPPRPRRALLFSNYVSESPDVAAVREACARAGIELDVIGARAGNATQRPEERLPNYDIVFAQGRSALEALAVGAAVVPFGTTGVGQMVTAAELDKIRRLNFGIRALNRPVTSQLITEEIARYDPADAAIVSECIRGSAGRDEAVTELIKIYQSVIAEHQEVGEWDPQAEARATSDYLRWLSPRMKELYSISAERDQLRVEGVWRMSELNRLRNSASFRVGNRLLAPQLIRRLYRALRRRGEG